MDINNTILSVYGMSMCMDEGGIQTAHLWLAKGSCLFFEGVATLGAIIVKVVSCLQSGEIFLSFTTSKDCLTVNGWGWLGLS